MCENKLIYHYTSPKGLEGILSSQSLWFTDFSVLNDESEGQYIYNLVDDVLSSNKYIKEYVDLVKDEISNFNSKYKYFICSFSHNGDSLPMWNYYTKSASKLGYNVQFNSDDLQTSLQKNIDNKYMSLSLYKVVYDYCKQKEVVETLLDKYYELFLDGKNIEHLKDFLHLKIRILRFILKHPSFSYEEESRLILKVESEYFESNLGKDNSRFNIRIIEDSIYAPYISLKFNSNELITQITASPIIKDMLRINSLNYLCKKYNLNNCLIKLSDIPLRY